MTSIQVILAIVSGGFVGVQDPHVVIGTSAFAVAVSAKSPTYFAMMKQLNKNGPQLVQEIAAPMHVEASISVVETWVEQGIVVDTRPAKIFAQKHLPGVTMDLNVFDLHDDSKFVKYEEGTPEEVKDTVQTGQLYVLDVRYEKELDVGYIPEAKHIMLGYLPVSFLKANGFKNVRNLIGGFDEWVKHGFPIVR